MKEFIKKNFALLLAFALPIVLIVVVALSVYIPALFISTDYNFIYASCSSGTNRYPYSCDNYLQQRFTVENGKLVVNEVETTEEDLDGVTGGINKKYSARIFLHDTANNESREINVDEAQMLNLSELITSPDGVTVANNYDRGANFFPFFNSSSSYGYYLTKGSSRSKLNLINHEDRYYYRDNFQFIGWAL